jgi:hypothetical protein
MGIFTALFDGYTVATVTLQMLAAPASRWWDKKTKTAGLEILSLPAVFVFTTERPLALREIFLGTPIVAGVVSGIRKPNAVRPASSSGGVKK